MSSLAKNVVDVISPYLDGSKLRVNRLCEGSEPWKVVTYSVAGTLVSVWVYDFIFQPGEDVSTRMKKTFWYYIRKIPAVKKKIEEETVKTKNTLAQEMHDSIQGMPYLTKLPERGLTEEELDRELAKYKKLSSTWNQGNCSGMVYSGEEKLSKIIVKAYGEFLWTNPLHAEVFPDIRKMEAEIVRMALTRFSGDRNCCGAVTTGGTESIMLAVKAYRDYARSRGIKHPEMIIPLTAHAAFNKGAEYFGVKINIVAVDPVTQKLDVSAMKRAINRRTCMLVGSCPQFPHGVIDPIEDIAKLGLRYNIPVHVDACLGGFLVCFMKDAGFSLPPFDFSVPGVTSISADTHKYGYAPKGSSIIMYSDKEYRTHQYFACTDWPGGIYASPSFGGSRAGAVLAATWAAMMYTGLDGYLEATRNIVNTARRIADGISKIKHLELMGDPLVSVVAFTSQDFDIFRVLNYMSSKEWHLSPLQFPSGIHICCTKLHARPGVADRLLRDLQEAVNSVMENPGDKCTGAAAMYGLAQTIPDRSIVGELAGVYFDAYYNTEPHTAKAATANGHI